MAPALPPAPWEGGVWPGTQAARHLLQWGAGQGPAASGHACSCQASLLLLGPGLCPLRPPAPCAGGPSTGGLREGPVTGGRRHHAHRKSSFPMAAHARPIAGPARL